MSAMPSVDEEVVFAGAARIAEMVRAKEVSPTELVQLYLDRIGRIEPKLNAYRVVLGEQAQADAKRAEKRLASGEQPPLLGVPVAIKDNVDYAGEVTTNGTAAYGEPAREDGLIVRRLREAGATIIGKTNLPELAIYPWTATPGIRRGPLPARAGGAGWRPRPACAQSPTPPTARDRFAFPRPTAGCSA